MIKSTTRKNNKIGILFTMAEFYRERKPELSQSFFNKWRSRIEGFLGDEFSLYFPGAAHDAEEFEKYISNCVSQGCSLLVVLPMVYTSSGAAKDAISGASLPVLVVSTAWDYSLPEMLTGDDFFANQAIHGVQDITNVLRRMKRPFVMKAGHFEKEGFLAEFKDICGSGIAASKFYSGRVGQLGGSLPGMLDFGFTMENKKNIFGFSRLDYSLPDVETLADSLSNPEVEEFIEWINGTMTADPGITPEELMINARYSLALEKLAVQSGLDALAMNFSLLMEEGIKTLPFLGASRLLSLGIGYGGEGDVLTALLNASLSAVTPDSTFSEFFCPDYGREEIILSHMGECNIALADPQKPILLKPRVFPWGEMIRPLVPVFQMKPGKVTLASISESVEGDNFQLVTLLGEIMETPEQPKLEVPHSRLRLEGDFSGTIEQYSLFGGTHHIVVSYGDNRINISRIAAYCGMDYLEL